MDFNWVEPMDITYERIDADFFKTEYVRHERLLEALGEKLPLRYLGDLGRLFTGPFGSNLPSSLYRKQGISLFRVQNVGLLQVDEANMVYLDDVDHQNLNRSEVNAGDILLSKAGRLGVLTVLPPKYKTANITEHIVGVKTLDGEDSHFIAATLTAEIGNKQIRRFGLGTILNYLGVESSRKVKIPYPDKSLQRAIGNKLRKAERLREMAETSRQHFNNWIKEIVNGPDLLRIEPYLLQSPDNTISAFKFVNNINDRLDPWPHHPAINNVEKYLECLNLPRVRDLLHLVTQERGRIKSLSLKAEDYYISVLHINNEGNIAWSSAQTERPSGDGIEVFPGDILFSGLNPKEKHIGCIPSGVKGKLLCSPEFSVLTSKDNKITFLLSEILRTNWVRVQATFLSRSSSLSRRRLNEDDLLNIYLPFNHKDSEMLNQEIAEYASWLYDSELLITQAKADVEALIEGALDEDKLLAESAEIERWLQDNPSPYAES